MAADILFGALLRGLIGGLDTAAPSPTSIDLVGDNGYGTGISGVCIAHFYASGDSDTQTSKGVEAVVNCNGDSNYYFSPGGTDENTVWTFTDPRIGPVTLSFDTTYCCKTYPWPQDPYIKQDTYSSGSAADGTTNNVGLRSIVPDSGPDTISGEDCKGNPANVRAGVHLPYSDEVDQYAIAFPWIGQAVACPSGSKKEKRKEKAFKA